MNYMTSMINIILVNKDLINIKVQKKFDVVQKQSYLL